MKKNLLFIILALGSLFAKAQFPNPYCAEAYSSNVEPITSVVFSNINNTSSNATGGTAHEDFLSIIGNVTAGNSYLMTVKGNTDGNYTDNIRVFIDWNNNNLFTDAGESFDIGTITNSTGLDAVNASATIVIPVGQGAGNVRMRVTKKWNGYQAPCNTSGYGQSEDYTLSVTAASGCSGIPNPGTISGPASACSGVSFSLSNTGYTAGTGMRYAWQSSAAAGGPWANIPGQTNPATATVSQTSATFYRFVDTCVAAPNTAISNVIQVTVQVAGCPPANDEACTATILTLDGAQDCSSTTLATSVGDPSLPGACSSPNNTVWYKYIPSSNGVAIARLTTPASANLHGWLAWYTATGSCPSLTLTPVSGSVCQEFGQTASDLDSLVSPVLTSGTTYYIMIDGFSGAFGDYCISIVSPPPPPSCVANISPANGATGVPISSPSAAAPITWNAAATATSYDIYFGTVNPPTINIGNIAAPTVTANITGLAYDTTYYWYVVPKNGGGPASGCNTNTTSFTVQSAPAICTPLTTSGCTLSDRIDIFRLKGESSQININTGTTCFSNSYVDSTDYSTVIDLARGKTYWGQIKAGTTGDYVTIWLDANDNGLFENSERLINNLPVLSTGSGTNINLFIPLGTALGNHRLRARLVYYGLTPPTALTLPCGFYTYSDTRDYLVNIIAGGTSYTVSTYASAGACYTGAGQITIDAASNNNSNYVPLVDSSNALVAQLYPQGNDLGTVTTNYYKHNGPVRQDPGGRYYLDRNLTITVSKQPLTSYNLRFPYQNSELNALIAQPGSGITSQFDLVMTKNPDACLNAIGSGWPGVVFFPTGFGSISGDRFVDVTNITGGFSSFYLHGGSTPIPVKVEYFTGAKQGSNNLLDWKVSCTNTPNATLTLERSADSRNFASVYSITATALRCLQPFSYTDTRALPGMNYYRLKMTDASGVVTYSAIVALLNKDKGLEIVNITPNPVTEGTFKLNISSSNQVKMDVIITDIQGRVIQKNNVSLTAGFNALDMKVNNLAKGTYNIYGITAEGKTRTLSFVKQ